LNKLKEPIKRLEDLKPEMKSQRRGEEAEYVSCKQTVTEFMRYHYCFLSVFYRF